MPARSAEEKARRLKLRQEKLAARKAKKAQEEAANQTKNGALKNQNDHNDNKNDGEGDSNNGSNGNSKNGEQSDFISKLPEDPFHHILKYLPARDLGAFSMTCREINLGLEEARVHHLFSRLKAENSKNIHEPGKLQAPMKICETKNQVKELLKNALEGSGDTGRLVTKKGKKGAGADEYIAYARFIEEAVLGRSIQVRDLFLTWIISPNCR